MGVGRRHGHASVRKCPRGVKSRRAGAEEGVQLAAHGFRLLPAAARSAPAYYVMEREAHGFGTWSLVLVASRAERARLLLRRADAEDFGADRGEHVRVESAAGPLLQQHPGLDGGAVARNLALGRKLVELLTEVVASPSSDEQTEHAQVACAPCEFDATSAATCRRTVLVCRTGKKCLVRLGMPSTLQSLTHLV